LLRRYLEKHGARKTVEAVGRVLLALVYLDTRVIVLLKDLDPIAESRGDGQLVVRDLGEGDLAELAELNRKRGNPRADRRFRKYVEEGFHGYVAHRGQAIAGYYWWVDRYGSATFPDLRRLGLGIELGPEDVYGSDFFVLEEHRGGGVAAEFLGKIESALRDRGYTRLWGYVTSENRPARWVYSTRGYKPMWIVRLRRILFARHITREPM
jgi:GNAT superfamily N-acetyltransferase